MQSNNPSIQQFRREEGGSIILPVMILLFVSAFTVASYLKLASHDTRMTREYSNYKKSMAAAEAGLDRAVLSLRNMIVNRAVPTQSELDTIEPPEIPGFEYVAPNGSSAFTIDIDGDYHTNETITEGRWQGLVGDYQRYNVRVGVTGPGGKGVVLEHGMQRLSIPVFQFGVFYEHDLEIHPGPQMVFAGPVHTNDSLHVGCNNWLYFDDRITVRSDVFRNRKNDGSFQSGTVYIKDGAGTYNSMGQGEGYLDHTDDEWPVMALQRWDGRFIDSSHNVPYLSLPIPHENEPHEIIERANPDGARPLEENKFENKADLVIWRDSEGEIMAELSDGTEIDVEYSQPAAVGGAININPNNSPHNEFVLSLPDGTTITRDDLHQWASDYTGPATLIHVKPKGNGNQNSFTVDGEVYELNNSDTYDIEADGMDVRLYNDKRNKHGKATGHWWIAPAASSATVEVNDQPVAGGRIADDGSFADWREGNGNPRTMHALDIDVNALQEHPDLSEYDSLCLYAYNNYQPTEDSTPVCRLVNGEALPPGGLTVATRDPIYIQGDYNTSDDKAPSLVAGDAVSILSNAWQDANSWSSLNSRVATNTTVNTIIMTGNTETTWGNYNGGLENVLRFCEKWSGRTLNYRGSILCMWYSQTATGPWVYGNNRYAAPNRDWGYDDMYRDPRNAPPGIPHVYGLEALTWRQSQWTNDELQ